MTCLALAVLVALLASLGIGRIRVPAASVARILAGRIAPVARDWTPQMETVVLDVRLPRALAGLLVGAGLAVSGAAFQGLFRNPLVSPHLLGVASGAGFGAALAILLGAGFAATQGSAFACGLVAVAMAYLISRTYRTTPLLMLVLAGTIVGSLFSALTSLVKYAADPLNRMPAIVFWLLGSLNNVTGPDLAVAGPIVVAGAAGLLAVRWRINLLAMGDDEARALGVHPERLKGFIIVCATLVTAAAVSISGVIGWIGLVIPHIGRMLVGPDHERLLPASLLIGGAYLVGVDLVARSVLDTEIPIGILTAIIGAPVFAYLLHKNRTGW
jgi:iron complex transport system permease protein